MAKLFSEGYRNLHIEGLKIEVFKRFYRLIGSGVCPALGPLVALFCSFQRWPLGESPSRLLSKLKCLRLCCFD